MRLVKVSKPNNLSIQFKLTFIKEKVIIFNY